MSYDPYDYMPKEKPYALYVHGMGSGAKSGTKSSLGHYLDGYEWLSPELPVEPAEAMAILEDYVKVFSPELIAGTSLGGLYLLYLDAPEAVKGAINPTPRTSRPRCAASATVNTPSTANVRTAPRNTPSTSRW